ncbi:MAG: P-II family nitrogen regulator [Methanoregulaceae archaeon]|nr:P-II family nitrogen regulator [Methanoregulaceae archaeon]
MKLIQALIREERFPFVLKALGSIGVFGMTIAQAEGRGEQHGVQLQYQDGIFNVDLLPKIHIEIVVKEEIENSVVEQICLAARIGKPGDGRIFVIPVLESHRVRTGDMEA